MKKKVFSFLFIIFCGLALAKPMPALAQDNSGFGAKVSGFFTKVTNQVKRAYIKVVPGKKDGRLVLEQAFYASEKMESAQTETDIALDFFQEDEIIGQASLSLNGPVKIVQQDEEKTSHQQMNAMGEFNFDQDEFSFDVDYKLLGDMVFIKLNQVPELGAFDMNKLMDKWLKFEAQAEKQEKSAASLTKEQEKELIKASTEFLKEVEVSAAENREIGEKKLLVVDVEFDKESLINYLLKVDKIVNEEAEADQAMNKEDLQKGLAAMDLPKITIGVDPSNFYVGYVAMEMGWELEADAASKQQLQAVTQGSEASQALAADQLKFKLESYAYEFDESVTIDKPENAVDAQEAVMEAMGFGGMGEMMPGGAMQPGMMPQDTSGQMPAQGKQPAEISPEDYQLTPQEMEQIRQLQEQYGQ